MGGSAPSRPSVELLADLSLSKSSSFEEREVAGSFRHLRCQGRSDLAETPHRSSLLRGHKIAHLTHETCHLHITNKP